eukprot:3191040-Prymnesium_polylepis.1
MGREALAAKVSEVGWRRRTDRPPARRAPRAGARFCRRRRCPFRLLYARDRCFTDVEQLSNAQGTPLGSSSPRGRHADRHSNQRRDTGADGSARY